MNNLRKIKASLLLLCFVFTILACDSSVALNIEAKKGDKYKYKTENITNLEFEAEGQKVKTIQNQLFEYSINIDDVDKDGVMSLNYKYDRLKIESESDGKKIVYDSNEPDKKSEISDIYNSIKGKEYNVKMDKYGDVKSVSGLDKIIDSILKSQESSLSKLDEATKAQILDTYKEMFNEETIKSSISEGSKIYPKKPVNIGESWEVENKIKVLNELNVKMKYTLKNLENDMALLDVEGNIVSDGAQVIDLMGVKMNLDFKGPIKGNIKVNTKNSFLVEGELKQDLSGKMSMTLEGNKIEMPMKANNILKYSTIK